MGSYEDIEKMEYNLILDYYRNHVACDKVIIGISGGLGEESAYIDMIQSYLLGVPQQGIWEYQTSEITKEKSYVNVTNVDKKGENERIYYYSSVDGYPAGTKEYIKHLFVSKLLGWMTYSRLFLHLREEKALCYDISTSILAYKDRGLLILNGSCRNKDSDYIQKYFEQEYQSIVQWHLSDEEFSITQDKLITDTYFQMETTDLEIAQLNYRYLMTGKLWTQEDIMKEFAGITKDSLLSLSKDTYNFKHFTHY